MSANNELLQAAKEVLAAESEVLVPFDGMDTHDVVAFRLRKDERRRSALAALQDAIARAEASASQPAPDEQREKAIALWREGAMEHQREHPDDARQVTRRLIYCVTRDEIDEAVALMRSAPPAPAEGAKS